jgi:glutamine cyclotransferase
LAAETVQRAQVVASYPHDPAAFTQGLVFAGGLLYEGTGLYGESSLRRVRLADGEVLQQVDLESRFFGEGIALLRGRIFQLTWREGTGFIYDLESLEKIGEFTYPGEGWGLTTDGTYLIMSDGSSLLRFLDPETLEPVGTLQVRSSRGEVTLLNELEYINGEIWANIWLSSVICRIDPQSGQVLGWIDLQQLSAAEREGNPGADVLNGIAWDAEAERIFVTGKLWSRVYEIRLVPAD